MRSSTALQDQPQPKAPVDNMRSTFGTRSTKRQSKRNLLVLATSNRRVACNSKSTGSPRDGLYHRTPSAHTHTHTHTRVCLQDTSIAQKRGRPETALPMLRCVSSQRLCVRAGRQASRVVSSSNLINNEITEHNVLMSLDL